MVYVYFGESDGGGGELGGGEEVEELLEEGMLVSSSNHLLMVMWMSCDLGVVNEERKCFWFMVILEGALGALGKRVDAGDRFFDFGNGSSRGCHDDLWWLIEDEEDGEVVICI
ncbi:hypothetical protein Tco_0519582 [Tanacetum coccineum]